MLRCRGGDVAHVTLLRAELSRLLSRFAVLGVRGCFPAKAREPNNPSGCMVVAFSLYTIQSLAIVNPTTSLTPILNMHILHVWLPHERE